MSLSEGTGLDPAGFGRYRAILIGASRYPDDVENLPDLSSSINGVVRLFEALTDPLSGLFAPSDVTMLSDPSSGEMHQELRQFLSSSGRDDVQLIYFSGHGIASGTELLLCGRDTQTSAVSTTTVSLSAIQDAMSQQVANRVILLLDCCVGEAAANRWLTSVNTSVAVVATRPKSRAFDVDPTTGASRFTAGVIAGLLRGGSPTQQGHLTVRALYDRVSSMAGEGLALHYIDHGDLPIARSQFPSFLVGRPELASRPVATQTQFGELLEMLRESSGRSVDDIAVAVGLTRHVLDDYFHGYQLPPVASSSLLTEILRACGVDDPATVEQWRSTLHRVRRVKPAEPRPVDAPREPTNFTGRTEELARLAAVIAGAANPPSTPVVVLHGVAGVGKSALAAHAASIFGDRHPDGVLWANLQGTSNAPAAPADVLDAFLRRLGVEPAAIPATLAQRSALFRLVTFDQRMLVVLDNAAEEAQLYPLLPVAPSCSVVVTCRRPLVGIPGVHLRMDVLSGTDAVELLTRTAGLRSRDLDTAELPRLAQICGYLPLALRIAGARLSSAELSVRDLVFRLGRETDRLQYLDAGQLSLRASLDLSYETLPPDAARMLRLGARTVGADVHPAVWASVIGADLGRITSLLDELVANNWMERVAPDRYRLHDLVRAYARLRSDGHDDGADRDRALRRVLHWYLRAAEEAVQTISPHRRRLPLELPEPIPDPPQFTTVQQALRWLHLESSNLTAAVQQADEHHLYTLAWQLPVVLSEYYDLVKNWADWTRLAEIAVRAAGLVGDRRGEALAYYALAWSRMEVRQVDEAIELWRRALLINHEVGDIGAEGWTRTKLGHAYETLDRHREALSELDMALSLHERVEDQRGVGWALTYLGVVHFRLGYVDDAMRHYEKALSQRQEIGDPRGEADALYRIGETYRFQGELLRAVEAFETALAIHHDAGDSWAEARTLGTFAGALRALGRKELAEQALERALAIHRELGDSWGEAATLDAYRARPRPTALRSRARVRIQLLEQDERPYGRSFRIAVTVDPRPTAPDTQRELTLRILLHVDDALVTPTTQQVVMPDHGETSPAVFTVDVPDATSAVTLCFRIYADGYGQLLREVIAQIPTRRSRREVESR